MGQQRRPQCADNAANMDVKRVFLSWPSRGQKCIQGSRDNYRQGVIPVQRWVDGQLQWQQ